MVSQCKEIHVFCTFGGWDRDAREGHHAAPHGGMLLVYNTSLAFKGRILLAAQNPSPKR
jgi:hypothetical protein